jgi:hypothetical protein
LRRDYSYAKVVFLYSLILSLEVAFVTALGPNGAALGEVIACIRRRSKVVLGGGEGRKRVLL